MAKKKVGIINVTGYAGSELARLLWRHPEVELAEVTGRSAAGQKLGAVFPHLAEIELTIRAEPGEGLDFLFSALPHKASAEALLPAIAAGVPVVDISADFRLKDAASYQEWYGVAHPAPQYLKSAVYGLTELNRQAVAAAKLVANPGCYPTAAILALAPALRHNLIGGDIIVDAKSGVSGAGRTLALNVHFAEANENVSAYSLDGHRHLPEIVQELAPYHPQGPLALTFLPHLIPMTRGILASCYGTLRDPALASERGQEEIRRLYREFYRGEPFVRVTAAPPQTKHTLGNNLCLVYPAVDRRTGRLMVISCLDNLVKGAAGQAVQNMNLMLGLPETTALAAAALYP
ncbi:MAG: N-acetyl-gamma-glutamyl-phosphate reductase [Chloroflexi bacterium]|nr:N-acetyl-gamma-glutamyl-phosphate reductase [Chloroflexota bacterium]